MQKDHQVKPALESNVSENAEAIDLKIKDLDDSKEENPGAFICVNDDDDNRNRTLDKDESGTVNDENDLVPLRIFLRLKDATAGTLTLEATSGGDRIKLWSDSRKGTEIALPKTWRLGTDTVPKTLYVKGVRASDAVRDVGLQLRYTKDGATESDSVGLTVVGIALTAQAAHDIAGEGRIDLKHFVTPKYDAGIAAWGNQQSQKDPVITEDKVTLMANITPNHQEVRDRITWEGAEQDAQDRLKAKVTKDNAKKVIVMVKLEGHPCKEARVWVVWATLTPFIPDRGFVRRQLESDPVFQDYEIGIDPDAPYPPAEVYLFQNNQRAGYGAAGSIRWDATIQPQEIITDTDKPNLRDKNTVLPPGPIGGVNMKWDMSRQRRIKRFEGPPLQQVEALGGNYPSAGDAPLEYPDNPVLGNDDASTDDEDNDPYSVDLEPFDNPIGTLRSYDLPYRVIFNSRGVNGEQVRWRLHFREFVRLELNGNWYRISDWGLWRVHIALIKQGGLWGKEAPPGHIQDNTNDGWDSPP